MRLRYLLSLVLVLILLAGCTNEHILSPESSQGLENEQAASGDMTVWFKRPDSWSNVKMHYWNTSPDRGSTRWPGAQMIYQGNDWFAITLNGVESCSMVFNNDSYPQSVDLTCSGDGWFVPTGTSGGKVVGTWYSYNPEGPAAASIKKGPYLLFPDDAGSMEVLWQVEGAAGVSKVEWGTTTAYGNSASPAVYGDNQYKYRITGLAPSTRYYYRVTVDDEIYTADFQSAPSASATEITFYAYGDTRTNPYDHESVMDEVLDDYLADASERQTMILHAGDFVGRGYNEWDWANEFFNRSSVDTMKVMASLPIMGARGNHEKTSGGRDNIRKYFPREYATGSCYYSFDYGPVHVTVIDLYTSYHEGSYQHSWVENDLATSTKSWKIVLYHEPAWGAGGTHANNGILQKDYHPMFVKYGVQMAINGDNHYYSRANSRWCCLYHDRWRWCTFINFKFRLPIY
jgi:hypothetical protein